MPFIDNQGTKIYYETAGDKNNPALFLAHGLGNSVEQWRALGYVKTLESNFYLIMMDMRGFGRSDKPYNKDAYTPKLLTTDCQAVLDDAGIDKCHFFGNSAGGSLGFLLANSLPDRFLSFTIAAANLFGKPEGSPGFAKLCQDCLGKPEEFFLTSVEDMVQEKMPKSVRELYGKNDLNAMIAFSNMPWPDNSESMLKCAQDHIPCYFFVGKQDPYEKAISQFVDKHRGLFEYKVIPDRGHATLYWDADTSAREIQQFIEAKFSNMPENPQSNSRYTPC